jgi:RNA polymerase sigma factor (sigma-70 family)
MNPLLALVREVTADPDGRLLERFRAERDEQAFAQLVRRYGPVVWGVCRRALADRQDAEDAFQATFLVLVRRADRLTGHPAVGPWLHRVAVLTVRNLRRANRRRAAVGGRLDHDIPVDDDAAARADARFDVDAVLDGLPEKYRVPVILCHLQGLSRREAAGRLGCPEGTLSAVLAAALRKLRARFGGRDPAAVLAAAGVAVVPAGLAAATSRAAAVYAISTLAAAGVSPVVAGLTREGLRMSWARKAALAAAVVLVGGFVAAGFAPRSGPTAAAPLPAVTPMITEPAAANPQDDWQDLVPAHVTGTVTAADGQPIAGAKVAITGTINYYATDGRTEFNGRATSAADGTYKLAFKTKPGKTVVVVGIEAAADGFVAHSERFRFDELKASADKPGKWDFVLAKGEAIAGRVIAPKLGDQTAIVVRGPSYSRTHVADKGGNFRVYVPKGVYKVTAVLEVKAVVRDEDLPIDLRSGLVGGVTATETVASGIEKLVLKVR